MQIGFHVNSIQEVMDLFIKWAPLFLPLIIIQLGLMIFAIVDIARKGKTKNLNVLVWIIVVVLVNMIGPILYFVLGRSDTGVNDDKNNSDDI